MLLASGADEFFLKLVQASLKSHNDSFDQLLRYIPAKFYMQQEEEQVAPTVRLRSLARVGADLSYAGAPHKDAEEGGEEELAES